MQAESKLDTKILHSHMTPTNETKILESPTLKNVLKNTLNLCKLDVSPFSCQYLYAGSSEEHSSDVGDKLNNKVILNLFQKSNLMEIIESVIIFSSSIVPCLVEGIK